MKNIVQDRSSALVLLTEAENCTKTVLETGDQIRGGLMTR